MVSEHPVTVIIFEFGKEGTCSAKVLYRVNTAQVTMYHIDLESLKLERALSLEVLTRVHCTRNSPGA